jgi:soluble lytic murein transglycosylase-like protein
MGLMQLMPGTARDMLVHDPFDPAQNIEGGARYLRLLANQYEGDPLRTLAAYNAGPEAVRRAGGDVPNIPETRAYVRKVVDLWKAYRTEL